MFNSVLARVLSGASRLLVDHKGQDTGTSQQVSTYSLIDYEWTLKLTCKLGKLYNFGEAVEAYKVWKVATYKL